MLTISFVIPAYNEERYLINTIKAIQQEIKATNIEAEIIVVDNNSTDHTRDLAISIDPPIILIDEPYRSVVAARKAGYLAATGDLIANIDADTLIPEGWITAAVQEFDKDPRLVAVSGPYVYYDMSRFQQFLVRSFYRVAYCLYLVVRMLNLGSMLQGGNAVVLRKAIAETDAYNANFTFYGEDTELARCLSLVGTVKFTLALTVLSSGRRLKQQGMVKTALIYSINYFWTVFFKKPYTRNWTDCR